MNEMTHVERKGLEISSQVLLNEALKYLKFGRIQNEYEVTLIDEQGYEIIKGYGSTTIEALNDMHHNLI